jgi:hypothetical protein
LKVARVRESLKKKNQRNSNRVRNNKKNSEAEKNCIIRKYRGRRKMSPNYNFALKLTVLTALFGHALTQGFDSKLKNFTAALRKKNVAQNKKKRSFEKEFPNLRAKNIAQKLGKKKNTRRN